MNNNNYLIIKFGQLRKLLYFCIVMFENSETSV